MFENSYSFASCAFAAITGVWASLSFVCCPASHPDYSRRN